MMTHCQKTHRIFEAWLALSEIEREAARQHAAGCESCRVELEQDLGCAAPSRGEP